MTDPAPDRTGRFVWVVTDQRSNHQAILAFVERLAQTHGPPDAQVVHLYVEKDKIVLAHQKHVHQELRTRIHRRAGARLRDPVLVFRDAECRTKPELDARRANFHDLVEALRPAFPNLDGVVFNPMSEGAFLLFDRALDDIGRGPELEDLANDKRADRLVNKDKLEDALGVADAAVLKRDLDRRMAALLFGTTRAVHAARVSTRHRTDRRGVARSVDLSAGGPRHAELPWSGRTARMRERL
ncbi:MAG: hypothetical protein ABMB14_09535 [Myxococcota bacterium]